MNVEFKNRDCDLNPSYVITTVVFLQLKFLYGSKIKLFEVIIIIWQRKSKDLKCLKMLVGLFFKSINTMKVVKILHTILDVHINFLGTFVSVWERIWTFTCSHEPFINVHKFQYHSFIFIFFQLRSYNLWTFMNIVFTNVRACS